MSDCPSEVDRAQLTELGVKLNAQAEKALEEAKKQS